MTFKTPLLFPSYVNSKPSHRYTSSLHSETPKPHHQRTNSGTHTILTEYSERFQTVLHPKAEKTLQEEMQEIMRHQEAKAENLERQKQRRKTQLLLLLRQTDDDLTERRTPTQGNFRNIQKVLQDICLVQQPSLHENLLRDLNPHDHYCLAIHGQDFGVYKAQKNGFWKISGQTPVFVENNTVASSYIYDWPTGKLKQTNEAPEVLILKDN